jgi:hypothetical protein
MRLLLTLASVIALTLGSPVETLESHPAVKTLNEVATQLSYVVDEVRRYRDNGNRVAKINTMFQHAQTTLNTLERATEEINSGPDLTLFTGSQFAIPIASLSLAVHQFSDVLEKRKNALDAAQASPVVFQYLQQAHAGASQLSKAMIGKLSAPITWIAKAVADEIVSKLANIENIYRPLESAAYLTPQQYQGQAQPQPNYAPYPPQSNYQGGYPVQLGYPPQQQQQQQQQW